MPSAVTTRVPGAATASGRVAPRWAPVVLGFVASAAIAIGGSLAGAKDIQTVHGAWLFAPQATGPVASAGSAVLVVGVPLLVVAWLLLLRTATGVSVRTMTGVLVAWAAPLVSVPPLFSHDIYFYAAGGEMVSRDINPYRVGPLALGTSSKYLSLVDPVWRGSPTPFGPLDVRAKAVLVLFAGHDPAGTVLGIRLMQLAAAVVTAFVVAALARRSGHDPGRAVALAVGNPLTLVAVLAAGHNDIIMMAVLLGGLLAYRNGHPFLALALVTAAGAIEDVALVGLAFIGWEWLAATEGWGERARRAVAGSVVAIGTMEVIGVVTRLGWGWLHALGRANPFPTFYAPAAEFPLVLQRLASHLHVALNLGHLQHAVKSGASALAVVLVAGLVVWQRRFGLLVALGVAFFVITACFTSATPWYLLWGVLTMAPVTNRRWLPLIIWVSVAGTALSVPQFYDVLVRHGWAAKASGLVCLLVALLLCTRLAPGRGSGVPSA